MAPNDERSSTTSYARRSGGLIAALPWIALILLGLFWCIFVLGITIALVDKGVAAWWVVLVFGALPLLGLYMLALRASQRPNAAPPPHRAAAPPTPNATPPTPEPLAVGRDPAPSEAPLPEPLETGELIVEPLTAREQEVLALLDKGRTNGEIARELYVSPATVKSHVNSIFRKLGARNRTEAVAHARRLNLIT
jgi:DNA-binding CsgD family transcriptional regulator